MGKAAQIVLPTLAVLGAGALLGSALRHRSRRTTENLFIRGGLRPEELKTLAKYIHSPDRRIRAKALELATNFAFNESYMTHLMELVTGDSGSPAERRMAISIIEALARQESNRQRLMSADVMEALCGVFVSARSSFLRETAARTLFHLVRDENERRMLLAAYGTLPTILQILSNQTEHSHQLVSPCIHLLHQMSQCSPLRDTLVENDTHLVTCQFWRANSVYRRFETLASYILQNILDLSTDAQAKQILLEVTPFGIPSLACALLRGSVGHERALKLIYHMAKHHVFVDELVKRSYIANTIVGLIPKDSYVNAHMALVCLHVLSEASEEVARELVDTDIIKSLQTCIGYGSLTLKVSGIKVLRQLLIHGLPVAQVEASTIMPHVYKLVVTEEPAAKLLWTLVELDEERRAIQFAAMAKTGKAPATGLMSDDKVLDASIKMINATESAIAGIGFDIIKCALVRHPASVKLLVERGLFDSLRKCILQNPSFETVRLAATAVRALLKLDLVTLETVHTSIAQVLLHNLQIRIPEARDLLQKLHAQQADGGANAVQLLSFVESHKKLRALLFTLEVCIEHPDLYALLAARHSFELEMIAKHALWFVSTLHLDPNHKMYAPRATPKLVERIAKLLKAKTAPADPPASGTPPCSEPQLLDAWFGLVGSMARLVAAMFKHDALRKVLLKQEMIGRLALAYHCASSKFLLQIMVMLALRIDPAELWRDHADALQLFLHDRHRAGRDSSAEPIMDALVLHLAASSADSPSRPLLVEPARSLAWVPTRQSASTTAMASPDAVMVIDWKQQSLVASHGATASGKWACAFSVGMVHSVTVGVATRDFDPVPELAHVCGYDGESFGVDATCGLKFHDQSSSVFTADWKPKERVLCLLDLDEGTLAFRTPDGDTATAFTDLDCTKTWFPAVSTNNNLIIADFDPVNLPAGFKSFAAGVREGHLQPLDVDAPTASPLPTPLAVAPSAHPAPFGGDLYYEVAAVVADNESPARLGWRISDTSYLLWQHAGEYEALHLASSCNATVSTAELAKLVDASMPAELPTTLDGVSASVLWARHAPRAAAPRAVRLGLGYSRAADTVSLYSYDTATATIEVASCASVGLAESLRAPAPVVAEFASPSLILDADRFALAKVSPATLASAYQLVPDGYEHGKADE
ncbi:hypothetical protein H9P43_001284 [Blastocladiella emersonii ATCC 22665]|nr:hypothetical protein H9P43_001284 [Blastocladiella emersonii ATCC 22665]